MVQDFIAAIDIGGTKIAVAPGTEDGEIIAVRAPPTVVSMAPSLWGHALFSVCQNHLR